MRKAGMLLIVALLLGVCTSCDLLNPKPFQLYNTNWSISSATSNHGHKSLHFTQDGYYFKDASNAVIERGAITNEQWDSYTYTIEECTISGFESVVGKSRFAAFSQPGDTLTIDFFLDSSKESLLISMTAVKL